MKYNQVFLASVNLLVHEAIITEAGSWNKVCSLRYHMSRHHKQDLPARVQDQDSSQEEADPRILRIICHPSFGSFPGTSSGVSYEEYSWTCLASIKRKVAA